MTQQQQNYNYEVAMETTLCWESHHTRGCVKGWQRREAGNQFFPWGVLLAQQMERLASQRAAGTLLLPSLHTVLGCVCRAGPDGISQAHDISLIPQHAIISLPRKKVAKEPHTRGGIFSHLLFSGTCCSFMHLEKCIVTSTAASADPHTSRRLPGLYKALLFCSLFKRQLSPTIGSN